MKYLDINTLKPNKLNPRKISQKQVEKLSASLKDNPAYFEARPIICDTSHVVWAGHGRLRAAKRLGLTAVPVHVIDLPQEKMREIMIRDNVSSGDWDTSVLMDCWDEELEKLVDFGLDIKWDNGDVGNDSDSSSIGSDSNAAGRRKVKKIIECPHCKKEFEL